MVGAGLSGSWIGDGGTVRQEGSNSLPNFQRLLSPARNAMTDLVSDTDAGVDGMDFIEAATDVGAVRKGTQGLKL